jgi:hypothetical protein
MTTPFLGIRLRITCTDGTTVTLFHNVIRSNFRSSKSIESDNLIVNSAKELTNSEINSFNLYPNPTSDRLNVVYNNNGLDETEIYMTDLQGKTSRVYIDNTVYKGRTEIRLSLTKYKSGIYFLTLLNGDLLETKKFILAND